MPGWSKNTSGDANRISERWRKVLAGSDGDQCAMYNVTLNTLAGQANRALLAARRMRPEGLGDDLIFLPPSTPYLLCTNMRGVVEGGVI